MLWNVIQSFTQSCVESNIRELNYFSVRMQLDIIENVKRAIQDGIAESMPLSSDVRTDMPSAMIGKEQVKVGV